MILGIGNDLIDIRRIEKTIDRFGDRFLKRVFTEPQPFDLVLWITGPAALPYLEDGPVSTSEEWARITGAFEGSFGSYAIWFN